MSNRFAVGHAPHITIEVVEGDLRLVGWENEELLAKVDDPEHLTVKQTKKQITLTCQDDLVINVPKGSQIQVQSVNGDMSVRGLTGELQIDAVLGDLAVRDVGSARLGTIGADFSLRRAKGDVHTRSVGGNASLREVDGDLTLDSVSDDLALRGVKGNLKVDVKGDIVAQLDPIAGQDYVLVAGDDIMVLLPQEASALLTVHAERIKVEWPGIVQDPSTTRVITLGEGAAQVKLDAGGDVVVTNRVDTADSADEYGNFAGMMFDWGGFGRDLGERISRRAHEAAERAVRKTEAAGRRVERQMRRGPRGKVEIGRWNWDFPASTPMDPIPPVSDEERMKILQMLADKKISAEEAEKLLAALGGEE
jgi:hypothetical protein